MAERRMFHTCVVESDAFLDLPIGAQALYFHLGMHADDDGFVNGPKQIVRKLCCHAKELQLLVDTGFLLNFDGIVVIRHWRIANSLQNDRIKPLSYPALAQKIYISENKAYTTTFEDGAINLFAARQALLESGRNPKKRSKKKNESPAGTTDGASDSALRFMSGKLGKGVVLLSEEQVGDLLDKLGLDAFDFYVEKLADFILRKHVTVTNHYATILNWWQDDKGVIK